jgi:hypothetical protein
VDRWIEEPARIRRKGSVYGMDPVIDLKIAKEESQVHAFLQKKLPYKRGFNFNITSFKWTEYILQVFLRNRSLGGQTSNCNF